MNDKGKPEGYWPALWDYIEQNRHRAPRRGRLRSQAMEWKDRKGLKRIFGLAGWSGLVAFRGLATPGSIEQSYMRWSKARALAQAGLLFGIIGFVGENLYWAAGHELPFKYNVWKTRWA